MRNYYVFYLACLIVLAMAACKPAEQPRQHFDESKYIAHLQLDSSTLIITEVAGDLEVPWEITFGSDGWIWFSEQKGTVNRLDPETGEKQTLL